MKKLLDSFGNWLDLVTVLSKFRLLSGRSFTPCCPNVSKKRPTKSLEMRHNDGYRTNILLHRTVTKQPHF